MGDDQLQDTSGASQTVANPSQPASVEAPSEAPANPVSTPESTSTSTNRPISTILADLPGEASAKSGSPPDPKIPLADPATDYTVQVPVSDNPTVATESASVVPLPDPNPADAPTSPPISPQSLLSPIPYPEEPSNPSIPPSPSVSSPPSSPSEPATGGSVQDASPSDQPIQVQPEVSVSAPSPQASPAQETPPQSAEIKPEPPQGSQSAPLADLPAEAKAQEGSNSQKSSFGDILVGSGEATTPSTLVPVPIHPPSPPNTSFGDLGTKPSADEPTINIEPIEPPKPVQSPLPAEASAKEGQSPDFSSKRQQALQTRRKKRDDHLANILTLITQKGKIQNSDAVTLLRVSQSTATNYLHLLVKDGKIKKEGKAKATTYSL